MGNERAWCLKFALLWRCGCFVLFVTVWIIGVFACSCISFGAIGAAYGHCRAQPFGVKYITTTYEGARPGVGIVAAIRTQSRLNCRQLEAHASALPIMTITTIRA